MSKRLLVQNAPQPVLDRLCDAVVILAWWVARIDRKDPVPEDATVFLQIILSRDVAQVESDVLFGGLIVLRPFHRHHCLWYCTRPRRRWWRLVLILRSFGSAARVVRV